jgi:hypothetical protein
MIDRQVVTQGTTLQAEYIAARRDLERAEMTITALTETGFPIEHMDVEFQMESKARAALARINQRLCRSSLDDTDSTM